MSAEIDHDERLRALLAAVALGDRQAFRRLYDATAPRLFGFALRVLGKEELAEEAVQDAYVSIWHAAASYQMHLSAPMTWMATIARNKALDILRRARAVAEQHGSGTLDDLAEIALDPAAGPHELSELSSDTTALAQCMETLAGRQRQAIAMAYLHDLSHSEVAERLSEPIGTVKTWIRRGLDRLRDCLVKRGMT